MPTVTAANLTLSTTNQTTRITVAYSVRFSVVERRLAGLGLVFRARIRVIGVDPPGGTTGTVLANFPPDDLEVTDGGAPQTLTRSPFIDRPRSSLQEDTGLGDHDEIRCGIRIAAIGLPPLETPDRFTDQEILIG